MIGLAGAHRTGKTTLAKAWAKQEDIDFVTISTTRVFEELALTPQTTTTAAARLQVQRALVQRCDEVFIGRRTAFISDRTPLDVAAYTLADAVQGFYTPHQQQEVQKIITDCIDICNAAFKTVLLIKPDPAIGYRAEKGKPDADSAYQEHVDLLIHGMLADERFTRPYFVMGAGMPDLDERTEALGNMRDMVIEDDVSISQIVNLQ